MMHEFPLLKMSEYRARDLQHSRAQHDLAQQLPAPRRSGLAALAAQVVGLLIGIVR